VVDGDRHVVGVVSEADLLHKIEFVGEGPERRIFAGRRRREARAKAHGTLARDLMSAPAITIVPRATLTTAAKLMDDEQVKRLPVTDELGRLVGIVSRGDLLRVYLRPDTAVESDVVEEVLRRTLWVEVGAVKVRVHDGVVTLSGRTHRAAGGEAHPGGAGRGGRGGPAGLRLRRPAAGRDRLLRPVRPDLGAATAALGRHTVYPGCILLDLPPGGPVWRASDGVRNCRR
jgi:hypothetical protein